MNSSDNDIPVIVEFQEKRLVLQPEDAIKLLKFFGAVNTKVMNEKYVKNETSGKYEDRYCIVPASMTNLCTIKFLSATDYLVFTSNGESNEG